VSEAGGIGWAVTEAGAFLVSYGLPVRAFLPLMVR
jgi:hypothetical protein